MACRMKEKNNVIGYVEITEDYWVMTTTTDIEDPNLHWHGNDEE